MNGNLAYWQLDFTVESQANLAPDYIQGPGFESRWGCMFFTLVVLLCRKNSKAFRGLAGVEFHASLASQLAWGLD